MIRELPLVHRSTEIRATEIIPDAWIEQNVKINCKNKKLQIEESVKSVEIPEGDGIKHGKRENIKLEMPKYSDIWRIVQRKSMKD